MTDTPPRRLDYLPVDDLPNDPRNAKGHDLPSVIASMERWGYTDPVEIDERTGLVASGHGRKAALQQMRAEGMDPPEGIVVQDGVWLAPVVRGWSSADDAEAGGYLVAANTTNLLGGWQPEPLDALLREVEASPAGLAGTGVEDVTAFLAAVGAAPVGQDDDDAPAPDPDGLPDVPQRQVQGIHEVSLMLQGDDYRAFVAQVAQLRRRWSLDATPAVILRALAAAVEAE